MWMRLKAAMRPHPKRPLGSLTPALCWDPPSAAKTCTAYVKINVAALRQIAFMTSPAQACFFPARNSSRFTH